MKNTLKIAAFVVLAVFAAGTAFAASPWTTEPTYAKKVAGKLDFGIKNLLGGWTAIITGCTKCDRESKEKPYCPILCTKKLLRGTLNAAVYTVGGAIHTATFPLPMDVPLPNDGVQF